MAPEQKRKRILVLGGGGPRGGLYIAGVIIALVEAGLTAEVFDLIIGISVGAQCGAFYVADQIKEGLRIWLDGCLKGLVNPGRWRPLDLDHLVHIFTKVHPLNIERIRNSKTEFAVLMTECTTGKAHYVDVRKAENIFVPFQATASFVPFTHPRRCNGSRYMDGGFGDATEIITKLLAEADDAIVVLTWPQEHRWQRIPWYWPWWGFPFPWQWRERRTMRRIPKHYNATAEAILAAECGGKVHLIAPRDEKCLQRVSTSSFQVHSGAELRLIAMGRRDTRRVLAKRKSSSSPVVMPS